VNGGTSVILWAAIASAAMVLVETGGLWLGMTRMSIPIILGSFVVSDRDRAALIGTLMHLVMGVGFGYGYAWIFNEADNSAWWLGLAIGLGHSMFVLGVLMPSLPGIHPRMAGPREGPEPSTALEAPGFLGLHYGRATLLVSLATHGVFGAVFGALYTQAG